MKKLKDMTNKELEYEFVSYDEMINKIECYGVKDMLYYHAIIREIEKRKGHIYTESKIVFDDEE